MKQKLLLRLTALALCVVLCLPLLGGFSAFADDEIWVEEPTGWRDSSHVLTKRVDGHLCNWGVRGETALFLSGMALNYYSNNEFGVGSSWGWFMGQAYEGGTGAEDATESALYQKLNELLVSKHTHETDYAETRDLYKYTDCMVNDPAHISSFYSGRKLNGAWDSGATWNREHTWPKSKASGTQNNDIMMLRPTSVQENSNRANMAYGEGTGYYYPNAEVGNTGLDLRGDCARICLYCYVRYPENTGNMWGQSGVIQSLDVLLSWMAADPVDTWEMGRNDAVQDITGVRNVFVDYPELAWNLFGREVPEAYPTPMNGGREWPPASSVTTRFTAIPEDPARGSVEVRGLCAVPCPAEGYYASGYDVETSGGWFVDPDDPDPYDGLLEWDRGRLLCMDRFEQEVDVVIHFTPVGETDPCPTGHNPDWENAEVLTPATCTESGRGNVTCRRCGKTMERTLRALGHDWDDGVITVPATVDHDGTITITCRRCGASHDSWLLFAFDDVEFGKYYTDPVYWALYHQPRIAAGTGDTTFGPHRTCTREQIVTFLWKACGAPAPESTENHFTDVKEGKYYYDAVLWAVEKGVTGGVSADKFGVGRPCTREQAVTFLWKACGSPKPTATANPFTDVKAGKYYYDAVLWAVENGITSGVSDTSFGVGRTCTRGQIVTFLYKAYGC